MAKCIILEEDVYLSGKLSFHAHREYKVHSNGTDSVNREFILSDINGRGISLFSIPSNYQVKE